MDMGPCGASSPPQLNTRELWQFFQELQPTGVFSCLWFVSSCQTAPVHTVELWGISRCAACGREALPWEAQAG